MVSVYFGNDRSSILDIDTYFNNVYEVKWFRDDFVKDMIKDVDKSEVLSEYCIQSPILGQIPPERLSGGVKALICLWKLNDCLIDLVVCGENCQKWLSEIFKQKDIRVSMSGYDLTFKGYEIRGICENDNSIISNSADWVDKMCLLAGEPENER